MRRKSPNPKPRFLWQALLITLPVGLLAGVGLWSLRQDRAWVEQEAKERAQTLADTLVQKVWAGLALQPPRSPSGTAEVEAEASLTNLDLGDSSCSFQVDGQARLMFPPAYLPAPLPRPLDSSVLKPDQVRLWQAARAAEYSEEVPESVLTRWRQFIASTPPPEFAAAAWFALGLRLEQHREKEAARAAFATIEQKYPSSVGESGLPLKPLADWQCLQLARQQDRTDGSQTTWAGGASPEVERLCAEAVQHPTILTPFILASAVRLTGSPSPAGPISRSPWQALWQRHELARQLYQIAVETVGSNLVDLVDAAKPARLYWLSASTNWLVSIQSGSRDSRWLLCRPEVEVRSALGAIMGGQSLGYFGAAVVLAGKDLGFLAATPGSLDSHSFDGPVPVTVPKAARSSAQPMLASSARFEEEPSQLKVRVFLADTVGFYARQRARSLRFGALIAVAALAALAGLAAAWLAFRRQMRLSELKSNFVSSVSHELRAPIASVRLLAEGLERGRVRAEEKKAEYYHLIVQECRRLSALIENVLDFSRIDQGRKQYVMEPTDICALVLQTVQALQPYAAERQVNLIAQLPEWVVGRAVPNAPPPGSAQIEAARSENVTLPDAAASPFEPWLDGRAIQQALINLIDNALKHSPSGATVTVGMEGKVEGRRQKAEEGNVAVGEPQAEMVTPEDSALRIPHSAFELWVEDHGEGIPASEQERIFERFYRCGSELRRQTQGVGIGLSIVQHIVEAHAGKVRVRSAPGQGSRFTLELPLREPTERNHG